MNDVEKEEEPKDILEEKPPEKEPFQVELQKRVFHPIFFDEFLRFCEDEYKQSDNFGYAVEALFADCDPNLGRS